MRRVGVVVGAPVYKREWIADEWLTRICNQWEFPAEELEVVVFGVPGDPTIELLHRVGKREGLGKLTVLYDLDLTGHEEARIWNEDRYELMAKMRNQLLDYANKKARFYLSCDTDMLLPPETLLKLAQDLGRIGDPEVDGIAPLTYMTPQGTQAPNCMDKGGVTRPVVQPDVFQVYAAFGVVLMGWDLMHLVRYEAHPQGEDIGWARIAARKGCRLYLDPHVKVKHVMHPGLMEVVDERIGF